MINNRPKVGVGALIVQDNKILLAKRKGSHGEGSYGSIGGHLEFGESPEEALKREALEELGITLGNLEFLSCTNMVKYDRHYIDIGFKGEIVAGEPKIQPDEVEKFTSVGWYPLDKLPEPLFAPIEAYLQAWQSGQRYFNIRP